MRPWSLVVLIAACGDNASPCDYVEHADLTNGTVAEATGLAIGPLAKSVCGNVDPGHYDKPVHSIDVDTFRITVDGSGELLVQLVGDPGIELLDEFAVRIFDTQPDPTLLAAGRFDAKLADHAAFVAQLAPGSYDLVVAGYAGADPSGPIGYRVRLAPDPSLACPAPTGLTDYVEAHDGPDNTGNDTVDVDFTRPAAFARGSGTPEPTRLDVVAGHAYRLKGASAQVSHPDPDPYLDRDTFEITTAGDANELAVRLDWAGDTADLDYIVFEADTLVAAATATTASTTVHEFQTFAVKPSTRYWLWVGGFAGGAAPTDPPTAYDVAVCGGHFFD